MEQNLKYIIKNIKKYYQKNITDFYHDYYYDMYDDYILRIYLYENKLLIKFDDEEDILIENSLYVNNIKKILNINLYDINKYMNKIYSPGSRQQEKNRNILAEHYENIINNHYGW